MFIVCSTREWGGNIWTICCFEKFLHSSPWWRPGISQLRPSGQARLSSPRGSSSSSASRTGTSDTSLISIDSFNNSIIWIFRHFNPLWQENSARIHSSWLTNGGWWVWSIDHRREKINFWLKLIWKRDLEMPGFTYRVEKCPLVWTLYRRSDPRTPQTFSVSPSPCFCFISPPTTKRFSLRKRIRWEFWKGKSFNS